MDSTRGRTFALGATLFLACHTEEPSAHEDGASTGSASTSAAASSSGISEAAGGSSSAGGSTDEGSTAMASSSGSSTTAAADEGSTGGSGTSDTTGEPTSACQQGCAVQFQCTMEWSSEEECVTACEANLVRAAAFAQACAQAWENVSECLGTLTCEELLEWSMPMTFPYPCADADEGLAFECQGQ